MAGEGYTIKEMLERQYTELRNLSQKADSIEAQTIKTNGRVTVLENISATHTSEIKSLQKYVAYGIAIVSVLIMILQNIDKIIKLFGG